MTAKEHFHLFDKKVKDEKIEHYDVCIVGAGPAGLTAGIYSSRYGLHTAIIGKEIGGMGNYASKIENYPGFSGSGLELMQKFYQQTKDSGAEFLNSDIASLEKDKTGFVVQLASGKVVHSKTLIIASGTEKKKLGVKGEEKFLGKGVSYCATCDAYFFKNKDVVVIGGGNSACKTALLLASIARKVYLVYRKSDLKCEKAEQNKLKDSVEIIYNAEIKEIEGKEKVEALILKNRKLKVSGIFIEIGSIPVLSIAKKLGIKTQDNYILVDSEMRTNAKGVFAAGDITKTRLKQVVVAASQGAIAAKSAYDWLRG